MLDKLKNPAFYTLLAGQGGFNIGNVDLGAVIELEALDYQTYFAISPESFGAHFGLIKYSEDGITLEDGSSTKEYLENLKQQGYKNAKMSLRGVLKAKLVKSAVDSAKGRAVIFDLFSGDNERLFAWMPSAENSRVKLTASYVEGFFDDRPAYRTAVDFISPS